MREGGQNRGLGFGNHAGTLAMETALDSISETELHVGLGFSKERWKFSLFLLPAPSEANPRSSADCIFRILKNMTGASFSIEGILNPKIIDFENQRLFVD